MVLTLAFAFHPHGPRLVWTGAAMAPLTLAGRGGGWIWIRAAPVGGILGEHLALGGAQELKSMSLPRTGAWGPWVSVAPQPPAPM